MATSPAPTPSNFGYESFGQASLRHFKDAQYLDGDSRLATAAHLYGFAAECGIKWLIVRSGQKIDKKSGYREHIDKLSGMYSDVQTLVSGRGEAKYLAMVTWKSIQDFDKWLVGHRYWHIDESSPLFISSMAKWRLAAQDVKKMMDAATLDGVL